MTTVGFTLIGRGAWSGGETYQRNMFGVIRSFLGDKVKIKLFLSPEQAETLSGRFDGYISGPPIVASCVMGAGTHPSSVLKATSSGSERSFARLVAEQKIDVMWESAQWFGNGFPVPVVSWLPDFQHRRLSHLFPLVAWWKRELGFRKQTSGRRTIILSSLDGKADCEEFYPASRGKTQVVRFAVDVDPAEVHGKVADVRQKYDLPERYFYLPNQFWSHKNHIAVVKSLALLKSKGVLGEVPPIYLTGQTKDPRDPSLFERIMSDVGAAGISSHFRHLGLVPYEDVFSLNAGSEALINPSLFEGWSTTVEEAKALGTPMVLSDIPLHREQEPGARHFDPDNAEQFADVLEAVAYSPKRETADIERLRTDQNNRRLEYAEALYGAFQAARDAWATSR